MNTIHKYYEIVAHTRDMFQISDNKSLPDTIIIRDDCEETGLKRIGRILKGSHKSVRVEVFTHIASSMDDKIVTFRVAFDNVRFV